MVEPGRRPGRVLGVAGTWPAIGRAGAGGIAPAGFGIGSTWLTRLLAWVRAEAGPGRLLPWVPIAFGSGIVLYFSASQEPVLAAVLLAAAFCLVIAWTARRHASFAVLILLAAAVAGFAVATARTSRLSHEILARPLHAVTLTGFVETRDYRERTDRFVLRVVSMQAPREEVRLGRVRLAVKKGTAPPVGSFVELKARLLPPLAPVRPGSYDFARDMYFAGIGASGFVMGQVTIADPPAEAGWSLHYAALMQGVRDAIDARIRRQLAGDERAIATALLTGRRDALSPEVNEVMFISGLGHVLSISGYHMALVAGVVFFACRALLALAPALATGFPIKKWSAAAALFAAFLYLLLSGAEVATQRSFLMTAVVLIAVMVDRRAITFRTLAVAALAVLAIMPEAVVHPSFQMSFAATLGLVALIQVSMPGLLATSEHGTTARIALWGGRELMMLALGSLVAGLATMPYVAFHFHRLTPYGLPANLAAMPVVSAVVMPAGLLGLLAMPFGLDGPLWQLMGLGIDWMIAVARWVARLPGAVGRMAAFGPGPLLLASAGIILLGLLRTPLRLAGVPLLVLGTVWALLAIRPDILVSADGRSIAVRGGDGRLHVMGAGRDGFLVREWLAADGDARNPADAALGEGVSCDQSGCVAATADGSLVAQALRADAFADDCSRAVVIVTTRTPPSSCAAQVLERGRLRDFGALALYWTARGFVIDSVRSTGRGRPWSKQVETAGDDQPGASRRPASPRLPDATPADSDLQPDDWQ